MSSTRVIVHETTTPQVDYEGDMLDAASSNGNNTDEAESGSGQVTWQREFIVSGLNLESLGRPSNCCHRKIDWCSYQLLADWFVSSCQLKETAMAGEQSTSRETRRQYVAHISVLFKVRSQADDSYLRCLIEKILVHIRVFRSLTSRIQFR